MKNIVFPMPICMAALILLGCRTNPTATPPVSEPMISTKTSKPGKILSKLIIGSLPPGLTLETLPAEFETITENLVMKPARVEYATEPTEYEWVEGKIEGFTHKFDNGTRSETSKMRYLVQEPSTELVIVPPLYDQDGNLVEALTVIERGVPAIYNITDVMRTISVGPGVTTIIPYQYKDGKTRMPTSKLKPKSKTIEKVHPAVLKQIESRRVVQLPTIIIRDETGQILHRFDKVEDLVAFVKSSQTP